MNRLLTALVFFFAAGTAAAADLTVPMHAVSADGVGEKLGEIRITSSEHGTVLTPQLSGLPPGLHGFHVHENGSCEPAMKDGEMTAAAAAGGHLDPRHTGAHRAPWSSGHLGDLPALYVDRDGRARQPVLAPRIEPQQIEGHALMIHAGGDNYSDQPQKLGGGGARIACGVAG